MKFFISYEVKRILYEQRQYSLNNIYDDDELIGHEWNQFISEGHWVKMIFDEKRKEFVSVKHYRTDKNLKINGRDKRIKEELNFNLNNVYGHSYKKNKKHISLSRKIHMRKSV